MEEETLLLHATHLAREGGWLQILRKIGLAALCQMVWSKISNDVGQCGVKRGWRHLSCYGDSARERALSFCNPWFLNTDCNGRRQKYPKIHVSTGEESSGSGTYSTQDLRPRHRRERNPKRPPRNLHRDWPFLRPPERVPEVPVVSRKHLPQLEIIQEVLPSRRDEAHFR